MLGMKQAVKRSLNANVGSDSRARMETHALPAQQDPTNPQMDRHLALTARRVPTAPKLVQVICLHAYRVLIMQHHRRGHFLKQRVSARLAITAMAFQCATHVQGAFTSLFRALSSAPHARRTRTRRLPAPVPSSVFAI